MWWCPPSICISFSGEFWAKCKKFRLPILNGVRIIKKRRNLDTGGHASYLKCGGAPHSSLSHSLVNSEQSAKNFVSLSRTVSDSSKKPRLGSTRKEMRTYLVPRMRRCPPLVLILFPGEFWAICKKFRVSISNGVRFIQKAEPWKKRIEWSANILRISNAEVPPFHPFFIFIWFSGEFWAKRKKFRVSISNGVRFIQKDATWNERGTQSVGQGCSSADVCAGKMGCYGKRPGYWKFSSLIVINVN